MFPEFLHEITGSLTRGRDLGKSLSQTKKLPQNKGRFWDRVRLLCSHQNINENSPIRQLPKDEQFFFGQEKRGHVPAERAQKITKGVRSR